MFGLPIGPAELILVALIALVVLGPGRLPEAGSALGKGLREFRKAVTDIQDPPAETPRPTEPSPATAVAPDPQPAPLAAQAVAPAPAPASASEPTDESASTAAGPENRP